MMQLQCIKKVVFLMGLFIFSINLTGCSTSNEIKLNSYVVEANTPITACELVASINDVEVKLEYIENNQIILPDNKNAINCGSFVNDHLGIHTIEYKYKNQIIKLNVEVVDTTPPTIISEKEKFQVEVENEYFNINELFNCFDTYDKNINSVIKTEFDINAVGIYDLLIIAEDSSGNQSEKALQIEVIEKEKEIVEVIVTPRPTKKPIVDNGSTENNGNTDMGTNGNSGGASDSDNSGGSSGGSGSNENVESQPYLSGVKDIVVSVDSSLSDLTFMLQSGISSSASISIDYAQVNLSVPGSYTVNYYTDDNQSATCTVTVQ